LILLSSSTNIFRKIKSRRIRLVVCVEHTADKGNIQNVLDGKPAGRNNIILKWFLEKHNAFMLTEFVWPRRKMIGGIL
jgi:hypothetical protein